MAAGRIFISYRRGYDNGEARSLYYQLERHFERDNLFMDVDDIPIGDDFVIHLDNQVAQCQALIAVIGRGWVQPENVKRLHTENDFVRIELEAALKRGTQIPIIPLLIDKVKLPDKSELPKVLRKLTDRNGVEIDHSSYASIIERRLYPALRRLLDEENRSPTGPDSSKSTVVITERTTAKPANNNPASSEAEPPEIVVETWDGATPMQELPPNTRFREHPDFPDMVVLPTGAFHMGSPNAELGRLDQEGPQRRVKVPSFAMAETTVTFDQWYACVDDGWELSNPDPDDESWGRGDRPVINVSWSDAQEFISWMNSKSGCSSDAYCLPSEAKWEYACRAGTTTAYSFGSGIGTHQAVFRDEVEARGMTLPVRSLEAANPWGLRHMHGNVWEWTEDVWHDHYLGAPKTDVPWNPEPIRGDEARTVRGGSWYTSPRSLRSATRLREPFDRRVNDVGFRVARLLPSREPGS
ncbi:MAG: SUMF1/EgtB/PvdO family nonheme iron enzyme [Pseudomonadota bacterium]